MAGMMDGLGLGSVNNLGPVIMSIIGVGLSAIILLTFAPTIAGDISAIALQGNGDGYCTSGGESLDRVSDGTGHTTANAAWKAANKSHVAVTDASGVCQLRTGFAGTFSPAAITLTTGAGNDVATSSGETYYSPQGEKRVGRIIITEGSSTAWTDTTPACAATATALAGLCVENLPGNWEAQSDSLGAGGLGTLIQLLFGAMGLMLPAGALGFMSYTGSKLVSEKFGGGLLTSALVVVVGVVVVGAILPQIIEPLDTFFLALDGNRFYIFSTGIGKLASTLGNFMGISLIAGVIALGGLLWRGKGGQSGSGSFA